MSVWGLYALTRYVRFIGHFTFCQIYLTILELPLATAKQSAPCKIAQHIQATRRTP